MFGRACRINALDNAGITLIFCKHIKDSCHDIVAECSTGIDSLGDRRRHIVLVLRNSVFTCKSRRGKCSVYCCRKCIADGIHRKCTDGTCRNDGSRIECISDRKHNDLCIRIERTDRTYCFVMCRTETGVRICDHTDHTVKCFIGQKCEFCGCVGFQDCKNLCLGTKICGGCFADHIKIGSVSTAADLFRDVASEVSTAKIKRDQIGCRDSSLCSSLGLCEIRIIDIEILLCKAVCGVGIAEQVCVFFRTHALTTDKVRIGICTEHLRQASIPVTICSTVICHTKCKILHCGITVPILYPQCTDGCTKAEQHAEHHDHRKHHAS